MNILVTGASGFLGRNLCPYLEKRGHRIVQLSSKNADLLKDEFLSTLNKENFDYIYHLAAWTQAGDWSLSHHGEEWIVNQEINTNMLTWWHEAQPQAKLIAMGSSCSYDPEFPHSEENYLLGKPTESLFTYAMTKRMLFVGLEALHSQFQHNYLCFVPSTLYGPSYHTDGRQMHFIFDLIRKIMRGKYYGEEVVLWGDGHQKRELVFVNDFVQIMVKLAETVDNELINIGGGEEYSIRDFAAMICKKIGYDPDLIRYDTSKYVGAKRKFLLTEKLNKLLPNAITTPLEEGLSYTIDWFEKEKDIFLKNY